MLCLLTLVYGGHLAQAAPALDPEKLPAATGLTEKAIAPKALESYFAEARLRYESFAAEDRAKATMSNETEQRLRLTKLPAREGNDRAELRFEKFTSLSRVALPGALKPFENRQDLGAYLFDKPLFIRRPKSGPPTVENLAALRASLEKSVRDSVARQGLKATLADDAIRGTIDTASDGHACLAELGGKAPGASWRASRELAGMAFSFQCEFKGWAEAAGRRVEILTFTMPKARLEKSQPSGAAGTVDSTGFGILAVDPASGELAMRQSNDIAAEPSPAEVAARKKRGADIPRGTATLLSTLHIYAP